MRKTIAVVVLVCVLAPGAFAKETRSPEPRFDFGKIVKRLVLKFMSLDEMLTGPKP